MQLLEEWFDTFQGVLTEPSEYFSREQRRDGSGYPLKFALVSLLLAGILTSVRTAFFGVSTVPQYGLAGGSTALMSLVSLVVTVVFGLGGLLIGAALVHLFVYLFGGRRGYGTTLAVAGYATVLSPINALLAFVPIVGGLAIFLVGIYGIYIQARGLESFQDLSFGEAILSVILPGVLILVLAIATAVAWMGALMGVL